MNGTVRDRNARNRIFKFMYFTQIIIYIRIHLINLLNILLIICFHRFMVETSFIKYAWFCGDRGKKWIIFIENKTLSKRIRVKFLLFKLLDSHSLLQGISLPRDWNQVFCMAGRFYAIWPPGKFKLKYIWLKILVSDVQNSASIFFWIIAHLKLLKNNSYIPSASLFST